MNDIEKMLTMIEDTDNHCRIMYNEVCDSLKAKGMTDEEILKTILHLHTNSTNALNGGIRSININNSKRWSINGKYLKKKRRNQNER